MAGRIAPGGIGLSEGTTGEHREREADRDRSVQRHPPRDGHDAVGIDAHEDEGEPGGAPEHEPESGSDVVVQRRQRARRQARVERRTAATTIQGRTLAAASIVASVPPPVRSHAH